MRGTTAKRLRKHCRSYFTAKYGALEKEQFEKRLRKFYRNVKKKHVRHQPMTREFLEKFWPVEKIKSTLSGRVRSKKGLKSM